MTRCGGFESSHFCITGYLIFFNFFMFSFSEVMLKWLKTFYTVYSFNWKYIWNRFYFFILKVKKKSRLKYCQDPNVNGYQNWNLQLGVFGSPTFLVRETYKMVIVDTNYSQHLFRNTSQWDLVFLKIRQNSEWVHYDHQIKIITTLL